MISKSFFKEVLYFLLIILVVILIRTFLFEISFVPTGSMKFSILPGDYIFSSRYSYGYSNSSLPFGIELFKSRVWTKLPDRGDIVIIKLKNMDYKVVKRLIALPGEKVEIKDDVVFINDIPVERVQQRYFLGDDGVYYEQFLEKLPNGVNFFSCKVVHHNEDSGLLSVKYNFGPFYVPKNHYFFLGDNRDNSADSRTLLGFVHFDSFVAKAQFVLISNKEILKSESDTIFQAISKIPHWLSSFRFNRFFSYLYNDPQNTR